MHHILEITCLQILCTDRYYLWSKLMQVVLQLSAWEQWCWNRGSRIPAHEMAKRIFAYINDNMNNSVSFSATESLVKLLQAEFPLTKATLDFIEARSLSETPAWIAKQLHKR